MFGKINIRENENDELSVKDVPTIKFYQKGAKHSPEVYKGDMIETEILRYVVKKLGLVKKTKKSNDEL